MNLEKGNIITLENNKKYLILDHFIYNNKTYLYITSLDVRHICFVEVTNIENEIDIKVVKDEKLVKLFADTYINNYSKERISLGEFLNLANNELNILIILPSIYELEDEYFDCALKFLQTNEKTNLQKGDFSTNLLETTLSCNYLQSLLILHNANKYPVFTQSILSLLKR